MKTIKNHDRAPDKKGFSVAMPKRLIAEIEDIARKENRTRNGQIYHFLERAIADWQQSEKAPGETSATGIAAAKSRAA